MKPNLIKFGLLLTVCFVFFGACNLFKKDQVSELRARIEKAGDLRKDLLPKQEKIVNLRREYIKSVEEVKVRIQMEMSKRNIVDFQEASKIKKIQLDLRTVQRRLTYIRKLDELAKVFNAGAEELLFLQRQAEMDINVAKVVNSASLAKSVKNIDAAIIKYQPEFNKLPKNFDGAPLENLEAIWQGIKAEEEKKSEEESLRIKEEQRTKEQLAKEEQSAKKKEAKAKEQERKKQERQTALEKRKVIQEERQKRRIKDAEICEEIIDGIFLRVGEVSELSPEAAEGLTKWKKYESEAEGTELSSLISLSPIVAKNLSAWPGAKLRFTVLPVLSPQSALNLAQWKGNSLAFESLITDSFSVEVAKNLAQWSSGLYLSLNSLKKISPVVALNLSQWPGEILYLNGLEIFSSQVAENLAKWKGFEISLDGLTKISRKEAKFLFLWKGKKLSLNGLTELSPESILYLSHWSGNELSLGGIIFSSLSQEAKNYLDESNCHKIYFSDGIFKEGKFYPHKTS